MNEKQLTYSYEDKEYEVIIVRKNMRTIRYRFKDGKFLISAPKYLVSQRTIKEGLDKFAGRLIKNGSKPSPEGDDYYYILGKKAAIKKDGGTLVFSDGSTIIYKDYTDFKKKIKKWYLDLVTKRTRYYESLMRIKPYQVHVRNMSTRYGSNSLDTRSINYAMMLVHYPVEIIDSVVVHELAHDKVRDHSKKFYDVVYKYYPNYKECHARLRKGNFNG